MNCELQGNQDLAVFYVQFVQQHFVRNVGTENFLIAKIYNMQICNVNVFLFTALEFEFQVILRSVFLNFYF